MPSEPREPSRLPLRGSLALAGTVGALAVLLSFRSPPSAVGELAFAANEEAPATTELVVGAAEPPAASQATPVTSETAAPATDPTQPALEPSPAAADAAASEPVTLTGDAYSFRFGSVQVAVTLQGGDIVDVVAISLPDGDRHSARISDVVAPILREEAIASDSADVSVISGATYTSRAYAASLQSALDQAS